MFYSHVQALVKRVAEETKVVAGETISASAVQELVAKSIYSVVTSREFIIEVSRALESERKARNRAHGIST